MEKEWKRVTFTMFVSGIDSSLSGQPRYSLADFLNKNNIGPGEALTLSPVHR